MKKNKRTNASYAAHVTIAAQAASRRRSINACMAVRPETNAKSELHFVSMLSRESANRIVNTPYRFPETDGYIRQETRSPIHGDMPNSADAYTLRHAAQYANASSVRLTGLVRAEAAEITGRRSPPAPSPARKYPLPAPHTVLRAGTASAVAADTPFRAVKSTEKPPMFSNYSHISKHLSLAVIDIQCYII